MFFLLFFTLDLAFLFLACEQYANDMGNATAAVALQKTGGVFGFMAAFLAWYNALAGIQDSRLVRPYSHDMSLQFEPSANPIAATLSSRSLFSTSPGLRKLARTASRVIVLRHKHMSPQCSVSQQLSIVNEKK